MYRGYSSPAIAKAITIKTIRYTSLCIMGFMGVMGAGGGRFGGGYSGVLGERDTLGEENASHTCKKSFMQTEKK